MNVLSGVFGLVAAGMTAGIVYFQWQILQHFRQHEDISMTQFFEDMRAPTAFNIMGVTTFIYAMTLLVSVAGMVFGTVALETMAQAGTLVVLGGFTYVFRLISSITA